MTIMQIPWGLIAAAAAVFDAWSIAVLCRPGKSVDRIAWMFLAGAAEIVVVAQVLSWRGLLADPVYWAIALWAAGAVFAVTALATRFPLFKRLSPGPGIGKIFPDCRS